MLWREDNYFMSVFLYGKKLKFYSCWEEDLLLPFFLWERIILIKDRYRKFVRSYCFGYRICALHRGLHTLHWYDKSGNELIGRYERKGRRARDESLLRPPDKRNSAKVLGDRRKRERDKIKIRGSFTSTSTSRHRDSSPRVVCVNPNNRSWQFIQLW